MSIFKRPNKKKQFKNKKQHLLVKVPGEIGRVDYLLVKVPGKVGRVDSRVYANTPGFCRLNLENPVAGVQQTETPTLPKILLRRPDTKNAKRIRLVTRHATRTPELYGPPAFESSALYLSFVRPAAVEAEQVPLVRQKVQTRTHAFDNFDVGKS